MNQNVENGYEKIYKLISILKVIWNSLEDYLRDLALELNSFKCCLFAHL